MFAKLKTSLKKITPIQANSIGIILMMGIIKIVFFLRDIIIAYYFGVSKDVDIYLFVLIVPMFLYNIISGSFYLYFVPTYLKIKTDSGPDTAKEYFSRFITIATPILALIAAFYAWGLPDSFLGINNVSDNIKDIANFRHMLNWAAVFFFFFTISSFLISLLQAEHHYARSFMPQILIPACSILFIVSYARTLTVASALYGTAVGSALSFLTLCFYAQKLKFFKRFHFHLGDRQGTSNIEQFFILIVSAFLPNLINMVDRQIAINLGEGKLTALNYGFILPGGLLEIFSAGMGIALYSYFSQWIATDKKHLMIETTQKVFICTISFIVPLCSFLIVYARPIIAVLFERGIFTAQDTLIVAPTLQCYAMMPAFAIIGIIGARIVSTTRKNQALLVIGTVLFVVKMLSNYILIRFFDFYGIPLATVLMYLLMIFIVFRYLHLLQFHIFCSDFLKQMGRGLIAATGVFFSFMIALNFSNEFSNFSKILSGACLLGAWLFITFRMNRRYIFAQFKRSLQNA